MTTQPVIIWTETPVRNLEAAMSYYGAVLNVDVSIREEGGRRVAAVSLPGAIGTDLFEDPAAGLGAGVLHFTVQGGLEAALARVPVHGGTIDSPVITIPQGRFAYTRDPDGNRVGLFEAA